MLQSEAQESRIRCVALCHAPLAVALGREDGVLQVGGIICRSVPVLGLQPFFSAFPCNPPRTHLRVHQPGQVWHKGASVMPGISFWGGASLV